MREHLPVDDFWSVTLPSWLTGLGTLGLAGVTFWLASREGTERKRLQSAEQERHNAQHRAQAGLVSAWYAGQTLERTGVAPRARLALANRSDEPVYNVVVFLVFIHGGAAYRTGEEVMAAAQTGSSGDRQHLAVLPPGTWEVRVRGGWRGMYRFPSVEIAFTDRSEVHWIRRADGSLETIGSDAITHYGIDRPVSYSELQPLNFASDP